MGYITFGIHTVGSMATFITPFWAEIYYFASHILFLSSTLDLSGIKQDRKWESKILYTGDQHENY